MTWKELVAWFKKFETVSDDEEAALEQLEARWAKQVKKLAAAQPEPDDGDDEPSGESGNEQDETEVVTMLSGLSLPAPLPPAAQMPRLGRSQRVKKSAFPLYYTKFDDDV